MAVPAAMLAAAHAAADAAGVVLRRYFRTGLAAERKSDASPVTVADHEAEAAMRAVLAAAFPDHSVLGEEAGAVGSGGRYCWVLDPIDGTRAFLTGRASFGTLVALLDEGVPVLGIIDQPIAAERWVGVAGAATKFVGAFGRVGARQGRALAGCELSCTSPAMFSGFEARRWQGLADRVGRVSYGGDCTAYGLLALGLIDIVAEADLKVWDWAALVPVVTGAGGCMTDWEGRALSADRVGRANGNGRVLALGDPRLLSAAVAALAEGTRG